MSPINVSSSARVMCPQGFVPTIVPINSNGGLETIKCIQTKF